MNHPLKTLLFKTCALLGVLLVLPLAESAAAASYKELDTYDITHKTSKGYKWPPWIPGTEGQKEARIQVLDATTMQPIEGAIVVGGYYGPNGRLGTVCAQSESAISDKDGWAILPNDQDPRVGDGTRSALRGPSPVSAYKRGYQLAMSVYIAVPGNNKWYIREMTRSAKGNGTWKKVSSRELSADQKSALMESKERSRIYLMPSTAKTEKERWTEMMQMEGSQNCSRMPFPFTHSEGRLSITKAVYQEMIDGGFDEGHLKYFKKLFDIPRYETLQRNQRNKMNQGKGNE